MNREFIQFALKEFTPTRSCGLLGCIDPAAVWEEAASPARYSLQTERLRPGQLVQTWVYQNSVWQECSSEVFSDYMHKDTPECVLFSVLEQISTANLLWSWQTLGTNIPMRSGVYVFSRFYDHWLEIPEMGLSPFFRTRHTEISTKPHPA